MDRKKIKCVVWDLDHTVWDGVLLEDNHVSLKKEITGIVKTLDERGILQSIVSKNNHDQAIAKLKEFGLEEYFLYPQINWNSKAASIKTIAELLNIGIDTFAFIDDQPFERDEVKHCLPQVLCIDAVNIDTLLDIPAMNPNFITEDSKLRRQMYLSDIRRKELEDEFVGPQEEFLTSLGMILTISRAKESDLQRAEELTVRTHQLNTTGYTYSYEELDSFRKSDKHILLIAGLEDKYGIYGKIGLSLIECGEEVWTVKLLLMSCRVMSRGVGSVLLNHIMRLAKEKGVKLHAEFVSNDRNRMMYVTYRFAGFREIAENENYVLFENELADVKDVPDYITLNIID